MSSTGLTFRKMKMTVGSSATVAMKIQNRPCALMIQYSVCNGRVVTARSNLVPEYPPQLKATGVSHAPQSEEHENE